MVQEIRQQAQATVEVQGRLASLEANQSRPAGEDPWARATGDRQRTAAAAEGGGGGAHPQPSWGAGPGQNTQYFSTATPPTGPAAARGSALLPTLEVGQQAGLFANLPVLRQRHSGLAVEGTELLHRPVS